MRAGLLSGASDEAKSNNGVKELQAIACLRPCCQSVCGGVLDVEDNVLDYILC